MKVGGSSGASPMAAGGLRSGAAAPGFAPASGIESSSAPQAASSSSAISGLDALLMLQDVEDATTRQRRAVRRAGGLLDRLEALNLALLGEGDAHEALDRLAQAARERRGAVDDPGVVDVLDAVETRAAVELAKRERALQRAA